jgi:hypothetical protein
LAPIGRGGISASTTSTSHGGSGAVGTGLRARLSNALADGAAGVGTAASGGPLPRWPPPLESVVDEDDAPLALRALRGFGPVGPSVDAAAAAASDHLAAMAATAAATAPRASAPASLGQLWSLGLGTTPSGLLSAFPGAAAPTAPDAAADRRRDPAATGDLWQID